MFERKTNVRPAHVKNREMASVAPESWCRSHTKGSGWTELTDRHCVKPGIGVSGAQTEKRWSHSARGEDDGNNLGNSAFFAHTFLIQDFLLSLSIFSFLFHLFSFLSSFFLYIFFYFSFYP